MHWEVLNERKNLNLRKLLTKLMLNGYMLLTWVSFIFVFGAAVWIWGWFKRLALVLGIESLPFPSLENLAGFAQENAARMHILLFWIWNKNPSVADHVLIVLKVTSMCEIRIEGLGIQCLRLVIIIILEVSAIMCWILMHQVKPDLDPKITIEPLTCHSSSDA